MAKMWVNGDSRKGKQHKLWWTHALSKMWYNRDDGDGETGTRWRRRGTVTAKMRDSGDGGLRRRLAACDSVPSRRSETCAIAGEMTG